MKKLSLIVIGLGFLAGVYAWTSKGVAETQYTCHHQVGLGEICVDEPAPAEPEVEEEEAPVAPIQEPVTEPIEEPTTDAC